MPDIPWTADQLTEGIQRALKAQDMEGVTAFLRVLAVVDPDRAQGVHDAIQAGLTMRGTP
jgi:hypothetical protein